MGFSIFLVLITIVCLLLIIVIMVQNPKGGGLSSTLGGSQMMGGVQKTTDFLDKSTWTLATILIVLILMSSVSLPTAIENTDSKIFNSETSAPVNTTPAPVVPAPVAPAPATTPAPVETVPQN